MIIIVYAQTTGRTIVDQLGCSEYSYYFVLEAFRPVLETFGHVVDVAEPEREVDAIGALARRFGEACVFLSFTPPHLTPVGLACPTIPVFAWEFDTLPRDVWGPDWRHDWPRVLRTLGRAITHSRFTVATTRDELGADFDVRCIPAPVWDRFAPLAAAPRSDAPVTLSVTGRVIDTRALDLLPYRSSVRRAVGRQALPGAVADRRERCTLMLSGIVYTSVFNPMDGRKNWSDMISAFVWANRLRSDATLVLKLTHADAAEGLSAIVEDLAKLTPFDCRVVLIDGFLEDGDYEALTLATHFAVNASHGEGQCLPLMEFMSAGIPAISPAHTAMADYVDPSCGFVVRSTKEPAHWPHDPRQSIRTRRHRIDWGSLLAAFEEAHAVATGHGVRYRAMSMAAHARLGAHCSRAVVATALSGLLSVGEEGSAARVRAGQRHLEPALAGAS